MAKLSRIALSIEDKFKRLNEGFRANTVRTAGGARDRAKLGKPFMSVARDALARARRATGAEKRIMTELAIQARNTASFAITGPSAVGTSGIKQRMRYYAGSNELARSAAAKSARMAAASGTRGAASSKTGSSSSPSPG